MTGEPRLTLDLQAELGEGPVWVEHDRALWFTDIKRQMVYRYDPATGKRTDWRAPEQVGFVFPTARRGLFIAGLQSGLHRFDPEKGTFELLVQIEPELPSNRLNDGVVDPSGRLWFGSMDNNGTEQSGAFYSFRDNALARTALNGIAITNGPGISPDGRKLYWVDTLTRTLSCCEIGADGSLGPSELVLSIDPADGYPDGPTVDSEGCIWLSLYAGWEARRYAPTGELLQTVRFPVANITKIALGGEGLRMAYATTARQLLTPEQLEDQPLAGGLFEFEVDVPGVPCPLATL